jgi:hypothetical protein
MASSRSPRLKHKFLVSLSSPPHRLYPTIPPIQYTFQPTSPKMTVSVISDDRDFLVSYLCAVIKYYILRITLTPVAYVFFTSFLIHHPDDWFPTLISPPWVTTIHSFHATTALVAHLQEFSLLPPPDRVWSKGYIYAERVRQVVLPLHATVVHGKLSGPLLRQGMFFIQDESMIFVAEELGHCATCDNYLVVIAVRFDADDPQQYSTFPLYLPIKIVEPSPPRVHAEGPIEQRDKVVWCPLRLPITLVTLSRTQRRLRLPRPSPVSPSSEDPSASNPSVNSSIASSSAPLVPAKSISGENAV